MLTTTDFVNTYKKDNEGFNYEVLKSNDFVPIKGTLEHCKGLYGNGDVSNPKTKYVLACHQKNDERQALVLTTRLTHKNAKRELQNIITKLETQHGFVGVDMIYCKPETIDLMIQTGVEQKIAAEQTEEMDTAAQIQLKKIVLKALELDASDIHIYIKENKAEYNFRVDGILTSHTPIARQIGKDVIASALQTMSDDFKEMVEDSQIVNANVFLTVTPVDKNGIPQKAEKIRLRTSKNGAYDGQTVTMRVIRVNQQKYANLHMLGLPKDIIDDLLTISHYGAGIFVMTGPTGSGKSTTLSAFYESIDIAKKLVLIEDPVEYIIKRANVTQQQVLNKDGYRLIDMIESVLRQDPDIVGISEIRSEEVAAMAIRQALTGHMMVSTMHTNDAISSVSRLHDLGIDLKTLSERNLLRGIMAQRLIPKLCPDCKVNAFKDAKFPNEKYGLVCLKNPKLENSCKTCDGKGTQGRVIIAELVHIDGPARGFIANQDYDGWEKHLSSVNWQSLYKRILPYIASGVVDPYMASHFIHELLAEDSGVHQYASQNAVGQD
jgi:general secretion pathway protein E